MPERNLQRSRVWRALRWLLPGWYRSAYGADLLQLHADRAGGLAGGLRFWLRLAGDVVLTSVQVRLDGRAGVQAPGALRRRLLLSPTLLTLRLSVRGLVHAPGFTFAVLATLALGIGANLTLFNVLDRLLLSPPEHIVQPEQVRRLSVYGPSFFSREEGYNVALSFPDYRDLASVRSFAAVAGHAPNTLTLGRGESSERVAVELASASYFPLLGARPALGRFYTEAEDQPQPAAFTAVVSHGFWQRHLGGARDVLGRQLELGKGSYTIVGVAPRGFTGVDVAPVDVWLPLQAGNAVESGTTDWLNGRNWYWLTAVVRLGPAAGEEAVFAEATTRYRAGRSADEGKPNHSRVVGLPVIAARGPLASPESRVARALGGVAIMMLVIACANAANLFLVRGVQRRKLLAVQSALGVGRVRLLLQLVSEALVLSFAAGLLAYGFSRAAGPLLFRTLLPAAAPPDGSGLRVLAVTCLLALATTVLAGIVPALRASRVDLMEVLRVRREQPRASWTRRFLLGLQAALSMILLVGAGLFMKSLREARSLDVGLDLNAVGISIELTNGTRFGTGLALAAYPALERLRAHPAVASAALTTQLPFFGVWGLEVDLPGNDSLPGTAQGPFYYAAGSDYFRTMGIPITRGRALNDADDVAGAPRVAVVGEAMARAVWPQEDPLGKCFIVVQRGAPPQCTTVVGVAGDVLPSIRSSATGVQRARQLYYLPPRHPDTGMDGGQTLVVRTHEDPETVLPTLRAVVRAAAPGVRFVDAATLKSRVAPQLRSWQLGATLLGAFGLLALLVAAAGLYSVLAFDVAQRRFELGVRAALGAPPPRLVRAIVQDMLTVTAAGVAAGTVGALLLARASQSLLFQVAPNDPVVFASAFGALLAIAACASALPAWRATRVDPRIALQAE